MGREQPKKPNLDKSCHRRRFRAISRRYAQAFYETNVQLIMYGGSRRRASAGMSLSALLCFLGFFVDVNPHDLIEGGLRPEPEYISTSC